MKVFLFLTLTTCALCRDNNNNKKINNIAGESGSHFKDDLSGFNATLSQDDDDNNDNNLTEINSYSDFDEPERVSVLFEEPFQLPDDEEWPEVSDDDDEWPEVSVDNDD